MAIDDRCRIIMLEDTREGLPLKFNRFKNVIWEQHQCLPVGDYQAVLQFEVGKEQLVVPSMTIYDRKSKGDLWGTMASKEYERFKREYNKSLEIGVHLVLIIECTIDDVQKGMYYFKKGEGRTASKFSGSAMTKKLETLRVKHGLEVVYSHGRTDMKRYIYERSMAECREIKRKYKEEKKGK